VRKVPSGFGLHDGEDVGGAAALVFVVTFGDATRLGWPWRADISVERNGLLIQTYNRFRGLVGFLVERQNIFHLGDVSVIEFCHGRGRDAGYPAPPAQIPTSGITA
jgi:hypothetical protein